MKTTIFSNFFYFEVVYLAEKSIFFDETFFVASGCPSPQVYQISRESDHGEQNRMRFSSLTPPPQPDCQITIFI